MPQSFKKTERLSSKKTIDELFAAGRSFSAFPYKVVWCNAKTAQPFPVQMAISVPKKMFKRAVDRNKVKRRTREAYRKQKIELYEQLKEKKIAVMFIYISKQIEEFDVIEHKIKQIISRLIKESEKHEMGK